MRPAAIVKSPSWAWARPARRTSMAAAHDQLTENGTSRLVL